MILKEYGDEIDEKYYNSSGFIFVYQPDPWMLEDLLVIKQHNDLKVDNAEDAYIFNVSWVDTVLVEDQETNK